MLGAVSDTLTILHPSDPTQPLVPEASLVQRLRAHGFIGEAIRVVGQQHFLPGPRFPELANQSPFRAPCTVAVPPASDRIEVLGGGNVEEPVCGNCRMGIPDWPEVLSAWWEAPDEYEWQCPVCSRCSLVWQLDWARSNGFGRQRIEIWHCHVAPSVELLEALHGWSYFHYRL